jgi:Cu(I)/Ag(I) efflux system membrane fusion protein
MKTFNNSLFTWLSACLLIAMGIGMGWWLALHNNPATSGQISNQTTTAPAETERKALYWYDPMQPQQHFDQPGKSPFMDMQLVAKYAEPSNDSNTMNSSHEESAPSLTIDPTITQNIGVRLATVARIPLTRQIEVTGVMAFNDRDVVVVQTRSGGFVERVWPLAIGDVVKAGQPLAEILVPDWAAAQQELLAVRSIADPTLLAAARERLQLLGMPKSLIQQLERTGSVQSRYTISAPIAGVIQDLEVRNGMTVMNGQTLVRINGLSSVWLEVAVPEAQADAVKVGNLAQVRLSAFPEQAIEGKVATILPMLNENSRSIKVRIELKNPQQQLRPGLSAQVTLNSTTAESGLAVATEALIRTGKRTLVMLAGEQGRFTPIEISTGHEIGDQTLITAGLEEGQQVVSSGQFLIDSEASLNGIEAHAPETEHKPATDGAQ